MPELLPPFQQSAVPRYAGQDLESSSEMQADWSLGSTGQQWKTIPTRRLSGLEGCVRAEMDDFAAPSFETELQTIAHQKADSYFHEL